MRIAYFDCFSGISGDMILGALLDAGLSLHALQTELNKLPLGGYALDVQKVYRQEVTGTQVAVLDHSPGIASLPGSNGNGNAQAQVGDVGGEIGHRRTASDLIRIITKSVLSEDVKQKAISAINLLAKAEAHVNAMDLAHRPTSTGARLPELAGTDALVSIVGAIAGLSLLGVERVECSPLNVGGGFLKTTGGVLPVPAPAAAEILREASVPIYGTDSDGEIVTATGAAIIVVVASAFGPMPSLTIDGLGYGMGKPDAAGSGGILRVTIGDLVEQPMEGDKPSDTLPAGVNKPSGNPATGEGEMRVRKLSVTLKPRKANGAAAAAAPTREGSGQKAEGRPEIPPAADCLLPSSSLPPLDREYVTLIECSLDDMSPRQTDFVMERLFAEGALDVYMVPVRARNNQPGLLLSVLCEPALVDALSALIFEATGAFELRMSDMPRRTLRRDVTEVDTPFGPIKVAVARNEHGQVLHVKPEYDDVKRAALELNVGVDVVSAEARRALNPSLSEAHQQIGRYRGAPAS